jgi:hypothetical protein
MMPEKMKQHVHLNVGVVLVHMKSIYFTSLKIHGKNNIHRINLYSSAPKIA